MTWAPYDFAIVHMLAASPDQDAPALAPKPRPPLLAQWTREIVRSDGFRHAVEGMPACLTPAGGSASHVAASLPNAPLSDTAAATSADDSDLERRNEKAADRTEYKRFHHRYSRVKRCVKDLYAASQWKVGVYIVTPKDVVYTNGNLEYEEFFTWAVHNSHKSSVHLCKNKTEQQLETLRVKYGIKRIVTWHLELLMTQMDALIDICSVRIAILISCSDQPLTITAGNMPAREIMRVASELAGELQDYVIYGEFEFEPATLTPHV
jgi:hypothetical protein